MSVKLVLRVGSHILMLCRSGGTCIFPGGHVERNEPVLDTLRRELREELGYDLPDTPKFFDPYEHIAPDGSQHIIILHYLLVLDIRPHVTLGDDEEGSEVMWLTSDELATIGLGSDFIRQAFAMQYH